MNKTIFPIFLFSEFKFMVCPLLSFYRGQVIKGRIKLLVSNLLFFERVKPALIIIMPAHAIVGNCHGQMSGLYFDRNCVNTTKTELITTLLTIGAIKKISLV